MCSQYTLKITKHDLITALRMTNDDYLEILETLPEKAVPRTSAPVLHLEKGKRALESMQFSLIPKWSKESKVKYATHNARLETIDEKPTFKDAFKKHHCIVPMTGFIEALYTGELAGNMVEFHPTKPVLLQAAGIWDEWLDKNSGEVLRSFTIVTHEPIPFVDKMGHDRSPVFLDPDDAEAWLASEGEEPKALKDFLIEKKLQPELTTTIERAMKAGWEKRK